MTVTEMHTALRLHIDKSTSLSGVVDFLPEELDFWLNEAMFRYIKQRAVNFEDSQKHIDDISVLVCHTGKLTLTANTRVGENVVECNLPITDATNPYLFYINSSVYDENDVALQSGETIEHINISTYIKDSINNPWIRRPFVAFYKGNDSDTATKISFIYGDEFIPTKADITYLKKPKTLVYANVSGYQTTTCELPEHTHREIVVTAAELMLENIESQRVQSFGPINAAKVE